MDRLSVTERKVYENQKLPMAIYVYENGKVITVAVSNGFCDMKGVTREELAQRLDDSMFNLVHPDDAGRLAKIGAAFAKHESDYDVVYRSRRIGSDDYHIMHTTGLWQEVESGEELAFLYYSDITDSSRNMKELNDAYVSFQHDNFYRDPVTGLANSNYLHEFTKEKISTIHAEDEEAVFVYLNMNGMRAYNNSYGYEEGDKLLQKMAQILVAVFPEGMIARGDADHFIIITSNTDIQKRLERVHHEIRQSSSGNTLGFQAGISIITKDMTAYDAYDEAKQVLRSIHDDYSAISAYNTKEINEAYWEQRYVLENFENALNNRWIKVFYQGIMRVQTGKMAYLEALARWIDPDYGTLSPASFIPVLERHHLLYRMDLYMIDQVCQEIPRREKDGLEVLPVSVNLSGYDFDHPSLAEDIVRIVDSHGVDHRKIILEVTEQTLPALDAQLPKMLEELRQNNFQVWVDDFGSGYSSLGVFRKYSFDLLKIDMELLMNLDENKGVNRVIIRRLIDAAHELGIKTLCEGLETEKQIHFLKEVNCDFAQGYMYHKPESLSAIEFRIRMHGPVSEWETEEEAKQYN